MSRQREFIGGPYDGEPVPVLAFLGREYRVPLRTFIPGGFGDVSAQCPPTSSLRIGVYALCRDGDFHWQGEEGR